MDDDHTQALITEVLDELLNTRNFQMIICSHVQGLVDDMWDTYYHLQPLRLRISEFQQTGPVIEDAETLQQCIGRASQLVVGNDENRRLALKVTRRSVELLIRSVCRQTGSTPPPHDSNPTSMVPFFRNCPGTTPQQAQGLLTTINFTNPSAHTQVGWAVPTQQQIAPHIDRVKQIGGTLGILP